MCGMVEGMIRYGDVCVMVEFYFVVVDGVYCVWCKFGDVLCWEIYILEVIKVMKVMFMFIVKK